MIRKHHDLSQEKFGMQIGLKKPMISLMENGKCNITEQTFRFICKEFNVNSEWLKTGEGHMLIPQDPTKAIAEEFGLSDDELLLIRRFVELPDSNRKAILSFMRDLSVSLIKSEENPEIEDDKDDEDEQSPT